MKTITMKDIMKNLEKADFNKSILKDESLIPRVQEMILNKHFFLKEIENGNITDVKKAEKFLELIDLIFLWGTDPRYNIYDIEHRLHFNNGVVEVESISEDCCNDWTLDYKDGALYIDGKDHGDSVLHLLNYIESGL